MCNGLNLEGSASFVIPFITFNGNLYKQMDGCGMDNPLSPVLVNMSMCKLEFDVIAPTNPSFYHRYVDDCLSKRKTNSTDHLLLSLNSYHLYILFTVEENPITTL